MNAHLTTEQLAAWTAGDLADGEASRVQAHVEDCRTCRERLDALRAVDAALDALRPVPPPVRTVAKVGKALADSMSGPAGGEIMTLAEVGDFLRLSPEQLGEIVQELPAFELAGQLRVRRSALLRWVEGREASYRRRATAGWAAHAVAVALGKGAA
jgi:hypothetical protein